jgi:hypothetical protein
MGLKEAERKAFRLAMFQDGWWDIYLGCCLIMMSFYSVLRSVLGPALNLLLLACVLVILLIGVYAAKKTITVPRVGLVRFGPTQKAKIKKLQAITLILVLATFVFLILVVTQTITEPAWGAAPNWIWDFDVDILFTVIIIGFFGLIAYALGIPRLHLYGWLLGLGMLASTILDVYAGFTFHFPQAISGGIILLIGVALFIRFLHDYPMPTEGSPSEGVFDGSD